MKLQVGRSYKNRLGHIIRIIKANPDLGLFYDVDNAAFNVTGEAEPDGMPSHRDLVQEVVEPIQLEIGRSYRSRNGDTIKIIDKKVHEEFTTFIGEDTFKYTADGKFHPMPGIADEYDLIELIQGPPMKSELKLEVGKTYRTRAGEIVKVVYIDDVAEQPVVVRMQNGLEAYYFDGSYYSSKSQVSRDIVEEVRPTKRIKGWVGVYIHLHKNNLGVTDIYNSKDDLKHISNLTHIFEIDVDAEEV